MNITLPEAIILICLGIGAVLLDNIALQYFRKKDE